MPIQLTKQYRESLKAAVRKLQRRSNTKVFCVGRNKTGTTSLGRALTSLGYTLGSQRTAELLIEEWALRDFSKLIDLVKTADAFQDVPFSYDYTYQAMDAAFPGSKFILSVRDSPDQWYDSLIRFTRKRLNIDHAPTIDDLKNDPYVYKGWSWRLRELVWGNDATRSFEKELLQNQYTQHNQHICDYFRHRPGNLLVINVGQPDAMKVLCEFLGKPFSGQAMPRENASKAS